MQPDDIFNDPLPPEVRLQCYQPPPTLSMTRPSPKLVAPEQNSLARAAQAHLGTSIAERALHQICRHPPVETPTGYTVVAVYLCFFAPEGARSSTRLSGLMYWSLSLFKEEYAHVECLFYLEDANRRGHWQALNVTEQFGSGLFPRDLNRDYRLGRWQILRLNNLKAQQRATLYSFALRERDNQRSYNYASAISTTPYLCACTPIVKYTPGCGLCLPSGSRTVFCVQLMGEMLRTVFPDEFNDVAIDYLRPDKFKALCEQRLKLIPTILRMSAADLT